LPPKKSKIQDALEKFDEKTQERLAERIVTIANETNFSSTQKNCIRVLKIMCPVALIFCAPVISYFFAQIQNGLDPFVFWLSLIPLLFLAIIAIVVNVIIKTPE
jgi:hypothetical protein